MSNIQIFGVKGSQATRAAERFFKERRATIQMVDLTRKALAPAEIKKFVERFGLAGILDVEGKPYIDREPKLLRLPLVRGGNRVSIGHDEESWTAMLP